MSYTIYWPIPVEVLMSVVRVKYPMVVYCVVKELTKISQEYLVSKSHSRIFINK